jgi:hypothetical protein
MSLIALPNVGQNIAGRNADCYGDEHIQDDPTAGGYFVASVGRERFGGTEMAENVVWHVVKQYAG